MKKLKELTEYLKTANEIKYGFEKNMECIKNSNCDKRGIGFNLDDRFSTASIKISIDSWHGYYGNSSCSHILSISNTEIFKRAFLEELNCRFNEIMINTANRIENKAKTLIEESREELLKTTELLNQLSGGDSE